MNEPIVPTMDYWVVFPICGADRIHGTAAGLNQYLWVMVCLDGLVHLSAQIVAKRLIYQNLMKERKNETNHYEHGGCAVVTGRAEDDGAEGDQVPRRLSCTSL